VTPVVFRKAQEFEVAFVRAGGLLGAGVDPTGNGGALPGFGDQRNLELLVEAGFTPVEAIRIMTLNGARILGLEGDLGSVEAGKLADLVILDGNPLENLRNTNTIRFVMKNGRLYEGDTLNEIWPRTQRLEIREWVADEPDAGSAGAGIGR
jgi:hypothetical protein